MSALILKLLMPFMVLCAQDDSWNMNGWLYACCDSPLSVRCLRAQAHFRLCPMMKFGIDLGTNWPGHPSHDLQAIVRPWQPLVIRSEGRSPRPMCEP